MTWWREEKMHMEQQSQCDSSGGTPVLTPGPEEGELNDAWHEVGIQFQQLGSRMAAAFHRNWKASGGREAHRFTMQTLGDDLRVAADRLDQAIREVSESDPDGVSEPIRATRRASEQSLEETRLLTAATLRMLNRQLDQLANRLDTHEEQ